MSAEGTFSNITECCPEAIMYPPAILHILLLVVVAGLFWAAANSLLRDAGYIVHDRRKKILVQTGCFLWPVIAAETITRALQLDLLASCVCYFTVIAASLLVLGLSLKQKTGGNVRPYTKAAIYLAGVVVALALDYYLFTFGF